MRALNVPAAGRQPEVSDLPVPVPGPGEVLLRVRAAGLNALDTALASGAMAERMEHRYPLVIGRDAAGVVERAGEGARRFAPGDEVFGNIALVPPVQAGTVAGYAVLPAARLVSKPAALDFAAAAALPLAGAAAAGCVDAVAAEAGQSALVVGATGGVGSYAVQLLAARRISVVATGTPADTDRLMALGAARVVDHTTGDLVEQVRDEYPGGVDAMIDLVSRTPDAVPLELVRKGGRIASTLGAADDQTLAAAGLAGRNVRADPERDVIAPLAQDAAAGALTVDIGTVLPLDRAAEGLATLAAGHARGKIVISPIP
ncbi:NADP-dependent oxidoreductase [Streptomyces aidingensis]|uniref:NADPH:quinone reductase n=1 Tax=Streptomyces aidingensis TaxID=910347 RepID=A0A1I1UKD7_9ACTN|nr:NADP-dependent oxidoreductase [Streptomyces aidingensis]SFD69213.1 NADPH:quinone reductase [Streptomyces aidingensis]